MALENIHSVTGRAVYVPGDDIDTDRIIPARFMKCVTFDGLGEYLFYDTRHMPDGEKKAHPLNDPRHAEASILVSGNNFGCGSSREHAPQAIYRAGFRAVVAESFAEIFFGNSIQLGMPCVTAEPADIRKLAAAVREDPSMLVEIDVRDRVVRFGGAEIPCGLRDGARQSLLEGHWDPIQDLLEGAPEVEALAGGLEYMRA